MKTLRYLSVLMILATLTCSANNTRPQNKEQQKKEQKEVEKKQRKEEQKAKKAAKAKRDEHTYF
jgi:hypothetical protein